MSETIRVPDPVYQRLTQDADEQDVSVGAIVRDWRDAYDRQQEIKQDWRDAIETREEAHE